jgi:hypothetical protein
MTFTIGGIMAKRSRNRTLADLEGKLGGIRREVLKLLGGLKREISKRERELAALKAQYAAGAALVRGGAKARPPRLPRRVRRARQINWKKVLGSLPARFSLKMLAAHPVAGRRPKGHLYAILSRWKKEGVLAKESGGGYRKVTAAARPKRKARRAKPARTPKPAPRPETPPA